MNRAQAWNSGNQSLQLFELINDMKLQKTLTAPLIGSDNEKVSSAADGYIYLGHILVQWGSETDSDNAEAFTFPTSFSATPYAIAGVTNTAGTVVNFTALSSTGFTVSQVDTGGSAVNNVTMYWLAVGPA